VSGAHLRGMKAGPGRIRWTTPSSFSGSRSSHTGDGLSDAEQDRLRSIEVALDQCWDVLRQRRARRNAGQDPDTAAVRSADVVEHYQQ
jgi:hypothetical protein